MSANHTRRGRAYGPGRHAGRSLLLAGALVAGLASCTEATPELPTVTSTAQTKQAHFPLRVVRQGGPQNYNDQLTIQADGGVLATGVQGQVTCTLDKDSLAVLNQAAAALDGSSVSAPAGTPAASAQILMADMGADLVPIDDQRLGKAAPVDTHLVTDVTGPAADRKLCT